MLYPPVTKDDGAPPNPEEPFVRVSTGPDMLAELEEMAKGLRTNIRDVQLKLESVLGSGAYGTVYKGAWATGNTVMWGHAARAEGRIWVRRAPHRVCRRVGNRGGHGACGLA